MFVWKRPKINDKEASEGLFKNNIKLNQGNTIQTELGIFKGLKSMN